MAEEVKAIWRKADCVCFDVDSTVCRDEGIDELAKFLGCGEAIEKMTREAMGGNVGFRESFSKRLAIMQPSVQKLETFLKAHPPNLTPGIKKLVSQLHARGTAVFLVSGGVDALVHPVAAELGISKEKVFCNRLTFYFDGSFAGFDTSMPTSESGGKPRVMAELKQRFGFERLVMIGDGVTDMEACPPADAFVGFGANVERPAVRERSKWFALSCAELADALQ